jgi:endo-1,4-beta-D-glucanase Y
VAAGMGKLDILQKIWEWAKEILTKEEINNKLLLATDNKGRTAWHVAASWGKLGVLLKIWEWAKENLTTEEINNKLLLATDSKGRTAWNLAAENAKLDCYKSWESEI